MGEDRPPGSLLGSPLVMRTYCKPTQELCKPGRLLVVLDGDEDRVQEDEDDDEPVESLTLDQPPYSKPENMHRDRHVRANNWKSMKLTRHYGGKLGFTQLCNLCRLTARVSNKQGRTCV